MVDVNSEQELDKLLVDFLRDLDSFKAQGMRTVSVELQDLIALLSLVRTLSQAVLAADLEARVAHG